MGGKLPLRNDRQMRDWIGMRRSALPLLFASMVVAHFGIHAKGTTPSVRSEARIESVVFTADAAFASAIAPRVFTLQPATGELKSPFAWRRLFHRP